MADQVNQVNPNGPIHKIVNLNPKLHSLGPLPEASLTSPDATEKSGNVEMLGKVVKCREVSENVRKSEL